ncbi:MAG TPA: glycosyltransferase family 4 protein [Pseudobacteroides sp.]|nr:glycosyltransferase family 4 protein [Pseudobacteroides sp.]
MNIGIFTDTYHPDVSGVVTSIDMLSDELKKRGHNVYIFTISNPSITKKRPGVFRLPSMAFIFYKSRRVGLFYSNRAAKGVKRLKLDIIHTQSEFSLGIFGTIMSKQLGIPLVHTYHTLWKDYVHYISKNKFKKTTDDIVKILSRNFCNACNAVIAPSKKTYDILYEYGVKSPIKIIPTGINLDRFSESNYSKNDLAALKEILGIKKDDPVMLFVGRIDKEKSIDMALRQMPEIIKKIPNVKFLIVGDGQATDDLKELACELGIEKSVIFTGVQPWDKIGMFYRLGDVFISCSITETQGLTLIEAMASDVPIIARYDRNIDGIIKNNKNGRIFRYENELAEIIIEVLTDKKLARSYAKNARRTVELFSSEEFGKNIENLYNEVIQNHKKVRKSGYNLRKKIKSFSIKIPRSGAQ